MTGDRVASVIVIGDRIAWSEQRGRILNGSCLLLLEHVDQLLLLLLQLLGLEPRLKHNMSEGRRGRI